MSLITGATVITIGLRIGHAVPDPPIWRDTVPATGDIDSDALRTVVTKLVTNAPDSLHFIQATSDGLYRDVQIKWAASVRPKAMDGDTQLVLERNRTVIARNAKITVLAHNIAYVESFDFFIPRGSLPPEYQRNAAVTDDGVVTGVLRRLLESMSTVAIAGTDDGLGGQFEATVAPNPVKIVRHDPELEAERAKGLEAAREGIYEENAQALEKRLAEAGNKITGDVCVDPAIQETKDWIKRMKELHGRMSEAGEGRLPQKELDESPLYRELKRQYTDLMAETARISSELDAAKIARAKARQGEGAAGSVGVDAAMADLQIQQEKRALKERLAVLRDCHDNPTAPTAIKAKSEDAAAHRRVSEAIAAVELQVDIESQVRSLASVVNSLVGTELESLEGAVAGILGEVEDELLRKSMDEAVKSLEKCIVRCDPCSSAPASSSLVNTTPAPVKQPTYTPGPGAQPTPPPPRPRVCKPMTQAEVWYRHVYSETNCGAGCSTAENMVMFEGSAPLNYQKKGQGATARVTGYEGTGTADLRSIESGDSAPNPICTSGYHLVNSVAGSGTLRVRGWFSSDESHLTETLAPRLAPESSTVEVVLEAKGTLHVQGPTCTSLEDRSEETTPVYQCTFENVDLLRGGRFTTGPQNGPDGAKGFCEISIH